MTNVKSISAGKMAWERPKVVRIDASSARSGVGNMGDMNMTERSSMTS